MPYGTFVHAASFLLPCHRVGRKVLRLAVRVWYPRASGCYNKSPSHLDERRLICCGPIQSPLCISAASAGDFRAHSHCSILPPPPPPLSFLLPHPHSLSNLYTSLLPIPRSVLLPPPPCLLSNAWRRPARPVCAGGVAPCVSSRVKRETMEQDVQLTRGEGKRGAWVSESALDPLPLRSSHPQPTTFSMWHQ